MNLTLPKAPRRALPWMRRGLALVLFMVMGGALSHAADLKGARPMSRVHRAAPVLIPVLVWTGIDVDGDGAVDFVNPTGGEARGEDDFGSGQFGASRDAGARQHQGVDYIDAAGQSVVAPISGFVTKLGFAYDDDQQLTFVEITNPALGYTARTFYVTASVEMGQAVRLGQPIGEAQSLQARYAGITNHVHLEIMREGVRIDAATLISEHVEMRPARA